MTFRHLRPNYKVPKIGTNRISTARSLQSLIDAAAGALGQARTYAQGFQEGQGVHRIPSAAVSPVRFPRASLWGGRAIRGAGWAAIAFDVWVRTERVLDAPPEDRDYQAARQTAGFLGDVAMPVVGGAYGEYAVETLVEGPRPLSMAFPTGYTWMIDAVIGEELARQDPEGVRMIERAYTSDQGAIDFWQALMGLGY